MDVEFCRLIKMKYFPQRIEGIIKRILLVLILTIMTACNSKSVEYKRSMVVKWVESNEGEVEYDIDSSNPGNIRGVYLGADHKDISVLKDLNSLKEFLVINSKLLHDVSVLQDFPELERINISGSSVSDIRFIQNLTMIKFLSLSRTKINKIVSLEKLTKLQRLSIVETSVKNISILKSLVNVTYLDVSKTLVQDLSPLRDLTKLRGLNISHTSISDIGALKTLISLDEIIMENTNVSKKDVKELREALPDCRVSLQEWIEEPPVDVEDIVE